VKGPMHWLIDNQYYRIETYPKNGQVWHIWNKKGSNNMWWFREWNGLDKGGDPINWSPNTWMAYPDRAAFGLGRSKGVKDWHYVVGWVEPMHEIIQGPIFYELKRWGPVWTHPEHTDTVYQRDSIVKVWAEVTYRFYDGIPWYYQSSIMETKTDFSNYFIRNNQMVFKDSIFTHLAMMPETKDLKPTDQEEICINPILSFYDDKPYHDGRRQHSLSNVIPSKIGFYSFFNIHNHDGFANIMLLEKNSNVLGNELVLNNHAMILTGLHDWAVYFARTFNYTNKRFNPENAFFCALISKKNHFGT